MVDENTSDAASALPAGLKAGWKTTEFWVTVAIMVAGFLLIAKDKAELATALLALGGISYNGSRAFVKKAASIAAPALLFFALVLASGCGPEGYVKADAISITVKSIRARHDAYVQADPKYQVDEMSKARQRTDLRDTELLDSLIDEALAQGQKKATADANTDRK